MAAQSNGKKRNRSSRPSHKRYVTEKRNIKHKGYRVAVSISKHRKKHPETTNIPPNMGTDLRLAVNSVLRSKREAEI